MTARCAALVSFICLLPTIAPRATADDKSKPSNAPATVENRVREADLTTIKLTADAERRLGIELATAERKQITRPVRLPGEVMIPPGRAIVVSAPVQGLITLASAGAPVPAAGQRVERGAALLRLQPGSTRDGQTFTPADRISLARAKADLSAARSEAEGQLAQALVRVEAAEVKRNRADQLRKEGAGAQRAFDEAQAELDVALSQRNASQERVQTLSKVLASLESDDAGAISIESPLDGYIRAIHVAPDQIIPSGAPLLEVVALDPVWVRVPVYVGSLAAIDGDSAARVRGLTEGPQTPARDAKRAVAPGSADARAATVDLYYELGNPGGELRPGQRVAVELQSRSAGESIVVPHVSILLDIYGGAWVYENVAPQTFTRRRVEVRDIVGDAAILARGLAPGAKVVTAGAAELFGTEFGVGK